MESPHCRLVHRIPQSLARVWEAWTDLEQLCRWDPDLVEGEMRAGAEIVMHWHSFGVALPVQVTVLEPERRLRLRAHRPDGSSQDLQVSLQDRDGHTELLLEIFGAMSEEEQAGTQAGWYCQLRILERFLSLPGELERHSFSALGPALASRERIYDYFREPTWLGTDAVFLEEEGQCGELTTREGVALDLELLALAEGHEIVLWCGRLGGVIRLRALPLAGGLARLVGAQVIRWGEEPDAAAIEEVLQLGVDRLIATIGGPIGTA